ncbi:ATP-binding protein [Mariniflexile soesokkakense]|uniref:histidine kinase n=1 Tax=Mariniflexile soesokkakense TaxID=1343160 RepID=A0ABV0AHY9_9FLAO
MMDNEYGIVSQMGIEKATKKFEVLFEEMPEAFFLHNFRGNIKKANKKACEFFELTKENLETMNVTSFISNDVIDSFKSGLKNQIDEKQFRLETSYNSKKNTKVPVEITSRIIKLGKAGMILTGFRDITVRKHYENLLIEAKIQAECNENELKLIFDNSPSSIFIFDEKLNILRMNNKAVEKFKINSSEIGNLNIGELINFIISGCNSFHYNGNNASSLLNIFLETTKGIKFTKEEVQVSIKTDNLLIDKTFQVSTSLLNNNNHSVYLATIDDVTKRKKIEQDLLSAKEKAEESDRLKSAFIQNLHHEIRTPLNGILGFIDFFADDSYNFTIEEKRELIEVMHKSGDRLLKTINDLLEISKLESGIQKVNNEIFDLKTHLGHFIQEHQIKFHKSEIEFIYEIDSSLEKKMINTDKSKLFQTIQNFLDNAFKFTHKGIINLKFCAENDSLIIYVEDSGIGVAPEFHDLIFKPFWQVHKDLDRYYEGNGLGLAVSKKTVCTLGGELFMKSELGKGSTFIIKLPKAVVFREQQVSSNTITNKEVSLEGKTILICEDDKFNHIYLEAVLIREKCKLIHASNGIEAVELFKMNPAIDIVLMDLKIPEMNGFKASSRIKEIRSNIPIIAQSAFALDNDKQRAFKAGCIDYLTKPINSDLLIATITKYLSSSS